MTRGQKHIEFVDEAIVPTTNSFPDLQEILPICFGKRVLCAHCPDDSTSAGFAGFPVSRAAGLVTQRVDEAATSGLKN